MLNLLKQGKQKLSNTDETSSVDGPPSVEVLKERIIKGIRMIYDPEIPVNIYDLGLIYAIDIDEKYHATITMTLTAPACPVAEIMPTQVRDMVRSVVGVSDADVTLVWDPPWSDDKMSDEAKLELGLL